MATWGFQLGGDAEPARPAVALIFASNVAIWGSTYVFVAIALRDFTVGGITFVRFALGAIALFVAGGNMRASLRAVRREPVVSIRLGLVAFGVPFVLVTSGQTAVSPGITAILVATMPLWAAWIGPLLGYRERVGRRELAGLIVGWIGVGLVVGADVATALPELLGSAAILLAAACYAFGGYRITRDLTCLPVVPRTATLLTIAAILTAPLAATGFVKGTPQWSSIVALVVAAVLCTGTGAALQLWLTSTLGAPRAALAAYLAPGFSMGLAVLTVGERVSAPDVVGLCLILAGVAVATRIFDDVSREAA